MNNKKNKNSLSDITIGIVLSKMRNEWNRSLVHGIKDAADESGINVIQYCNGGLKARNSENAEYNIIGELINTEKLDALILNFSAFSPHADIEDCEVFCQRFASLPVILLNSRIGSYVNIVHDEYKSVAIATRHLVEVHQYHNIGLLNNPVSRYNQISQFTALRDTLNSYNIPVNNKLVTTVLSELQQEAELLAVLFKLMEDGAEAIIVGDNMAKQVIFALTKAGVEIPDEIAVMGINNLISSQFTVPPLSSIERSFYKMGRKSIEKTIDLLNGKSIEKSIKLEPFLIRRSSCGCFNQPVHEITDSIASENLSISKGEFIDNKDKIVSEIVDIVGNTQEDHEIINKFLLVYDNEIKNPGEYIFLNYLTNIIKNKMNFYISPYLLQKILSILIKWSLPYIKKRDILIKMQFTWQQARLIIDDFTLHNQAQTIFQTRMDYEDYYIFSKKLMSTFDIEMLLDIMAKEMPRHNIPYAFLVLYENPRPYKYPDPIPPWSYLAMAYTENGRIDIDGPGIRFQTKEILPGQIWQDYFSDLQKNYYCIVESLALAGRQIGYMIFGVSGRPSDVSYWLKNVISTSLQRAVNLKKLQAQGKE